MHCPGPYHRYLMKMQQYKIWMLLQKRIHLIVTSQMQQSVLTILVHSWKQKNNWYLIWENEILCQIVPNRAGTVKMIQKSASKNFLDPIQNRALSRSVQLEAVYLEALLYHIFIWNICSVQGNWKGDVLKSWYLTHDLCSLHLGYSCSWETTFLWPTLARTVRYGNMGCPVFKHGVQN